MYFFILSSQTAVNWKLWFTREGCFCPVTHGWYRCRAEKWCSLVNHGAAFQSMIVLREGCLLSHFNSECMKCLPQLSPRLHAWLSLDVHVGWSQDAITVVLHQVCWDNKSSLAWGVPVTSQRFGQDEFCPVLATENAAWLFPVWRNVQ